MRAVMVIDDNSDIRALLKQALQGEGYQVLAAENGKVAQTLLTTGARPALLLLDLMMPVMDGPEFLTWKNGQPEVASIPVVIISAMQNNPNLPGSQGYLRKPIDLDEMFSVLDTHFV